MARTTGTFARIVRIDNHDFDEIIAVPNRDIAGLNIPDGAMGVEFFDSTEILRGNKTVLGVERNVSPFHYIGEVVTVDPAEIDSDAAGDTHMVKVGKHTILPLAGPCRTPAIVLDTSPQRKQIWPVPAL